MVKKVSKKLASWKRSCISLSGKITLIKATLSNVPVYYMSMHRMPQKVMSSIERLQWNFLWEGSCLEKDHLVRWEVVFQPKEHGGLSLGRIKDMISFVGEAALKVFNGTRIFMAFHHS